MVRYVVLGLLRDGRCRHGYAIMKECREATGITPSVANIYRELHGMLTLGWVRAATNPPGADARRVPYAITSAGAAALDEWLAAPGTSSLGTCGDSFSLRAFIVAHVGGDLPPRVLTRWREDLVYQRQVLRRERDAILFLRKRARGHRDVLTIVLERRLRHVSTDLDFVERLGSSSGPLANAEVEAVGVQRGAVE